MAKLQLTDERRQIISQAQQEWLAAGLSTEPADFETAKAAITRLYERIDLKRPRFVTLSSPLGAELYIHLLCQLDDQLRGQLDDQLRGQLWGQLGGQLKGQLDDQLRGQLDDQLRGQLDDQLWDQLKGQLDDQLRGQLDDQLRGQLDDQLRGQLKGQLDDQLRGQLDDQLRGQLDDQLGDRQIRMMGTWFWGQWDAYLWGWGETGRRIGVAYPPELDAALDDHCAIVRSIGWWYPFRDFCIITDRPDVIGRDALDRLHSDSGPALHYRDGYTLYAVHGVRVDPWIIEQPEKITVEAIGNEANAETRRVMIERYGPDKYLLDSGAEPVSRDETGILYCKALEDDEPIIMVRVLNSTPEPDGALSRDEAIAIFGEEARAALEAPPEARFKEYMLRVPPNIKTARAAVAWTFGIDTDDYRPEQQS